MYKFDDNVIFSSTKNATGISLDSISWNTGFSPDYVFMFTGATIVNERTYTKLPELLGEVVGLSSTIFLLLSLFVGKFSEFKYYENLHKEVHHSSNGNFQQVPQSPGQEDRIVTKVEPISVSYFEYLYCKMIWLYKSIRDCKEYKESNSEVGQIEAWGENVEDQLDVVNFIGEKVRKSTATSEPAITARL